MNEMERLHRQAKYIKEKYPSGTRIHLENMEDPFAPVPSGTRGTVVAVDDIGQIHMDWDNGRTLALVPGVDTFRKLNELELKAERESSLERKTGLDQQISRAAEKSSMNRTDAGRTGPDDHDGR